MLTTYFNHKAVKYSVFKYLIYIFIKTRASEIGKMCPWSKIYISSFVEGFLVYFHNA